MAYEVLFYFSLDKWHKVIKKERTEKGCLVPWQATPLSLHNL